MMSCAVKHLPTMQTLILNCVNEMVIKWVLILNVASRSLADWPLANKACTRDSRESLFPIHTLG